MRKARLVLVGLLTAGMISVFAGPANAGPLPCKITYHDKYLLYNPLCLILEEQP